MRRRKLITLFGGAVALWSQTVSAQNPKGVRRIGAPVKYLCLGIFVIFLIFERAALATENFAGFAHINQPTTPDVWGPIQTEKTSLANLAPALLPFFNNGPYLACQEQKWGTSGIALS